MEIEIGNLVKTYCDGEICIGQIKHIFNKDKLIDVWIGGNQLCYEGEEPVSIPYGTAIWNKREMQWVFNYPYEDGKACFGTVMLDACKPEYAMWRMGVDNEKVIYKLP